MMRPRVRAVSGLLFLGVALALVPVAARKASAQTPADSAKKLKVYISVDMEGVAGTVTADQLGPSGFEYERFRHFMTDETMAAVRAANEAGASEIVVSDSHGNGENLLIEEFPKNVRIVRAWPRHGGMMAGLDSSFSAAIFIGYHASTTNPKGVRAHTFLERALRACDSEWQCGNRGGVQRRLRWSEGSSGYLCIWRRCRGGGDQVATWKHRKRRDEEVARFSFGGNTHAGGFLRQNLCWSEIRFEPAARLQALCDQDSSDAGNYVQELHASGTAELPTFGAACGFAYDPVCGQGHG